MDITSAVSGERAAFIAAALAVAIFWSPVFSIGFGGLDEINVFSSFADVNAPGDFVDFLLTPHNEHFAPVFKLVFCMQHLAFGLRPAFYQAVNIALFIASAFLLFGILRRMTNDLTASITGTFVYATNSIYYTVISWGFEQQLILALIFMEIAIILTLRDRPSPVAASFFCVLSAFCLKFGLASWMACGAFILYRLEEGSLDKNRPALLRILAPYVITAVFAYAMIKHFEVDVSVEYGVPSTDVLFYIKGVALYIGNMVFGSLGAQLLTDYVYYKASVWQAIMPPATVLTLMWSLSFLAFLIVIIVFMRKLESGLRRIATMCIALSVLTVLATLIARGTYYNHDIIRFANISRYSYYPVFFMLLGLAPIVVLLPKKARTVILLLAPVLIALHFSLLLRGVDVQKSNWMRLGQAIAITERTIDTSFGDGAKRASRQIEQVIIREGRLTSTTLVKLFLKPGERLVEKDGKFFVLINNSKIDPKTIKPYQVKATNTQVADAGMDIHIGGLSTETSLPAALYFTATASKPMEAALICPDDPAIRTIINIKQSRLGNSYTAVIPCLHPEDIAILHPAGDFAMRDIRLLW